MPSPAPSLLAPRVIAALGLLGVAGNLAAVAYLGDVPHAYRPASLERWLAEALAAPGPSERSAVAFTLGLIALAAFFLELGRRAPEAPLVGLGGRLAAIGAVLDAAGTPAPGIVVRLSRDGAILPGALAWLELTCWLDSAFNVALGLGLLALALGGRRELRWPAWLVALPALGGLGCVVAGGQLWSDTLARAVLVAGPFWLLFVVALSARLATRGAL
jgi:hypothetical protein